MSIGHRFDMDEMHTDLHRSLFESHSSDIHPSILTGDDGVSTDTSSITCICAVTRIAAGSRCAATAVLTRIAGSTEIYWERERWGINVFGHSESCLPRCPQDGPVKPAGHVQMLALQIPPFSQFGLHPPAENMFECIFARTTDRMITCDGYGCLTDLSRETGRTCTWITIRITIIEVTFATAFADHEIAWHCCGEKRVDSS